ncbi:hypothetical protein AHAS_Ahas16G0067700 [Arachis hypogaea]
MVRDCLHKEDRNYLEKLTLAVLSHLPTAVLYVHDLSGECGTSPSDQFSIYKEIKERFSGHLWLDVVSKFDLLKPSPVVYATEKPSPTEFELEKYRKSDGEDKTYNGTTKRSERYHSKRNSKFVKKLAAKIEEVEVFIKPVNLVKYVRHHLCRTSILENQQKLHYRLL